MHLKKIKLAGFKSFVDPTRIVFKSNRTAIVGPNGCGKSNIIDATRWVMGESSAKQLRGEAMADVIFNGTSSRKPVGQASIELFFDNTKTMLIGEYAKYNEIAIRREINRDGLSNYYLNSAKCRRKDVVDVFLGTGLGPRSYAIIEQGMIAQLIEAKPDELRVFFEEAAGISKYKERRKETENRIRHTRENLARLSDIREELGKQLKHLKRQANAANRYKILKQEQRLLKAQLQALHWRTVHDQIQDQEANINNREMDLEAKLADASKATAAIEELREQQTKAGDALNEVQGRYYSLAADIARIEQQIQNNKDRCQELNQDLVEIEKTWQELQQHITNDKGNIDKLNSELTELTRQLITANQAVEEAHNGLINAEQTMQQGKEDFPELFNAIAKLEQEYDAIKKQNETIKNGLKVNQEKITEKRQHIDNLRAELDVIRNDAQKLHGKNASLETLQQIALGKDDTHINTWLTENELENKPRLAEGLKVSSGWEKAVETVLNPYLNAVCVDDIPTTFSMLEHLEGGSLTLFDASHKFEIKIPAQALADKVESNAAVANLLTNIYAVTTLKEALDLRASLKPYESVVTQKGIWLGSSWAKVNFAKDAKSGILQRKLEMQELEKQIQAQQKVITQKEQELQQAKTDRENLESERTALQQELTATATAHTDVYGKLTTQKTHLEHLCMEKLQAARDKDNSSKQAADRLNNTKAITKNKLQYLQESLARSENQISNLRERKENVANSMRDSEAPLDDFNKELQQTLEKRLTVENELTGAKQKMNNAEHTLREAEAKRTNLQKEEQAIRNQLEQTRMEWKALQVRCTTYEEQITEGGFELEALLTEIPESAQFSEWEEKLDIVARKLERLGPINLAAIGEYEQKQKRKTYLDDQNDDLTEALQTLEEAIHKIDRETKARFKQTFDSVNTEFARLFPIVFGGGKAALEMTENDLLNTGIIIVAQPPGKRNTTIHLLSGGEKALTAIALVFAIFQLNPAPFCMLDEVDAPLDDNNIIRFCKLVQEMSNTVQFVVVTHNKTTMEMADQLLGVTMQEPGVSRMVSVDIKEAVAMAG